MQIGVLSRKVDQEAFDVLWCINGVVESSSSFSVEREQDGFRRKQVDAAFGIVAGAPFTGLIDALELLSDMFSGVLVSPRPTQVLGCSVTMEYLDCLPEAQKLGPETLILASPFSIGAMRSKSTRLWSGASGTRYMPRPRFLSSSMLAFHSALGSRVISTKIFG